MDKTNKRGETKRGEGGTEKIISKKTYLIEVGVVRRNRTSNKTRLRKEGRVRYS